MNGLVPGDLHKTWLMFGRMAGMVKMAVAQEAHSHEPDKASAVDPCDPFWKAPSAHRWHRLRVASGSIVTSSGVYLFRCLSIVQYIDFIDYL